MTGRGIDQVLPHPLNPRLYEPYLSDARAYVDLAENANGPVPRPVDFDYIWGEALPELRRAEVDLRIINLETAITTVETHWLGKEIHYRMHPHNIDCLSVAGINGCALANNDVLDWGYEGLSETLRNLDAVGVKHAGAGNATEDATAPAVLNVPGKCRVLLFSFGSTTSGIQRQWRATSACPGVNLLDDLRSEEHTSELQSRFDLVCRLLLEKKKNIIRLRATRTADMTPPSQTPRCNLPLNPILVRHRPLRLKRRKCTSPRHKAHASDLHSQK